MKQKMLGLALLTAACGMAQVHVPRSILTHCPPTAAQAKCVLQEALVSAPGLAKAAMAATPVVTAGPFQRELDMKIWDGSNAVVARVDIPAGMQLAIESVSTYGTVPGGQAPRVSLSTTVKGSDATFFVPLLKQDTVDKLDWLCGTQAMKIYNDGDATFILITRTQTAGDATFSMAISGTLSPAAQ